MITYRCFTGYTKPMWLRIVPWRGVDVHGVSTICQAVRNEASAVVVGEVGLEGCWVAEFGTGYCHLKLIWACAAYIIHTDKHQRSMHADYPC